KEKNVVSLSVSSHNLLLVEKREFSLCPSTSWCYHKEGRTLAYFFLSFHLSSSLDSLGEDP
ncbi:hypothetical protein PSY31_22435, partial [Shigella flexneri]|nr:hypothetical protein [Shigella flexneri]